RQSTCCEKFCTMAKTDSASSKPCPGEATVSSPGWSLSNRPTAIILPHILVLPWLSPEERARRIRKRNRPSRAQRLRNRGPREQTLTLGADGHSAAVSDSFRQHRGLVA